MPFEPGLIDANVLVYAMDADAPQHLPSRALLEAAREGSATLFVTSQILCEFYSIVSNARRVARPRSSADALEVISGLVAFLHVVATPTRAVTALIELLRQHPVTGGDVFDVQLVATMQANDIHRIYTFNTGDFEVFSDLDVQVPTA